MARPIRLKKSTVEISEKIIARPTLPKPRPPVAMKPPLPKRPMNLQLKPPSPSSAPLPSDSPPASPIDRPVPLGNIYKVMRKPKPKKTPPQVPPSLDVTPNNPISSYDSPSVSQALYDLPPLPDPQPLLEDPGLEPEFDPDLERLGASGQEQDAAPRNNVSCGAEAVDRKKPKVPPPVPKKPRCVKPTSTYCSNGGSSERLGPQADSPMGARSPLGALPPEERPSTPRIQEPLQEEEVPEEHPEQNFRAAAEHPQEEEDSSKESSLQDSYLSELDHKMSAADIGAEESTASESSELQINEETEDVLSSSTHTTEDLFTIIHRSKRKVLGRKEPSDSFGGRQTLSSPVKSSACASDLRGFTLSSAHRSSSRNENFMALLQKKSNKTSGCGTRVSAAELLKSTNPLARRVTELSAANANEDAKTATSNCNQ
ncbi:hypothetical protein WMY93_015172 [Mugilogobius chulae]|uniref:NHS-like protein 2 n=1 Tax=Mugilogobius chulae TaxID=88201 RepID=A0AAW0P7D4_9GOBI